MSYLARLLSSDLGLSAVRATLTTALFRKRILVAIAVPGPAFESLVALFA
jgi:hypothetical protein